MALLVISGPTKLLWTLMIVDVVGYAVVRDDNPKKATTEQTDRSLGQMDHKVMSEVSADGSLLETISLDYQSSSTQVLDSDGTPSPSVADRVRKLNQRSD